MNFKAVIFDLDGLLIDSEPLWAKTDIKLLGKRGFTPTQEHFNKRLGTGNKGTIEIYKKEFGISESTQMLMRERQEIFDSFLEKGVDLMDGARELLKKLKKTGVKMAIATSGPHKKHMPMLLKRLKIDSYFSAVVTADDVKNAKPAPDLFLKAAEELGVDTSDCLVLEDAPNGIIAAKRAGMAGFGVNKNKEVQKELKKAGADKVFSTLTELRI